MKSLFKNRLVLAALLAASALSARADIYSYKFVSFTNSAAGPFNNTNAVVLTNGATLVVNSDPIRLRAKNGLTLLASFIGTNAPAASTNVIYSFDLGIGGPVQGTNWTTTRPVVFAPAYNTNAWTIAGTNYSSSTLDNFAFIRLAAITAPPGFTNTITVSNVWASFSTYAP